MSDTCQSFSLCPKSFCLENNNIETASYNKYSDYKLQKNIYFLENKGERETHVLSYVLVKLIFMFRNTDL